MAGCPTGPPGAIITDASLLAAQGWCFRGSGYADTVSGSDWTRFSEAAKSADRVLRENKTKAAIDPEYYAVMVKIYPALHRLGSDMDELVAEAVAREPYYLRTYFNAAIYHLPQWGGSYEEVDEFARYAVERTRTSDKTGLYARIYWSLEECGCDVRRQAADWDDLKQSMRDVYERYPASYNAEYFKNISCLHGDGKEALIYIRATSPEATSDDDLVARIETCKTMREE